MIKIKKKCLNCKKKIGLLGFECKYCNKEFCSSCRYIIVHNCKGLENCKKEKISELKDKLDSQKIIISKLIKI